MSYLGLKPGGYSTSFDSITDLPSAQRDFITGTGASTYPLTWDPGSATNLEVTISGVTQNPSVDYTVTSGGSPTITFTTVLPTGMDALVMHRGFATGGVHYQSLINDPNPTLGADLDVNSYALRSSSNGDINVLANGTGRINLDGMKWPLIDGAAGQALTTDGNGDLAFTTVSGGGGGGSQDLFKTIAVAGQSNIVADNTTDTLTFVGGTNVTLTTDAGADSITINASGGGTTQNLFDKIAVSGQSNVEADSTTDTLTFVAGANMTITTNAGTDTITFVSASGGGVSAIDDLSDVDTTTAAPSTGQALKWNGTNWVPGTIIEEDLSDNTTDDLAEGSSNLYYTNERVDDRVDALITDGTGINTTYNDSAGTLIIDVDAGITASKIVQLDTYAKLPAIDGSQLTNLPSGTTTLTGLTDVDAVVAGDDGKVLYYDHSTTSFKWKVEDDTPAGYNNTNWDTAYGWGDHSGAGYLTGVGGLTSHTDVDAVVAGDDGKIIYYDHSTTSFKWKVDAGGPADTDALPEGSTNLYYTDTRTDARITVARATTVHYVDGNFGTAGDSRNSKYISRGTTTDATQSEIFVGGTASNRISLQNNAIMSFEVLVTATRETTFGGAGWQFVGLLENNAGVVSILGTVTKRVMGKTTAAYDVSVDETDVNDALRIRVTGEASHTVRWMAVVNTVEVAQ